MYKSSDENNARAHITIKTDQDT